MAASEAAERRGLSRRDMIKASAAAGAAAWTAPVILDSLASPAAAATFTPPCGCHFVLFNGGNCNPDQQGTPCQIFTGCTTFPGLEACMTVAAGPDGKCQSGATVTVDTATCPECRITGGSAKSGNDCYFSDDGTGAIVVSNDGSQVVFNQAPNGGTYAQLAVFLTCPSCA